MTDKPAPFTLVAHAGPGERIVGIVLWQNRVIVATERGVWIQSGGKFREMEFVATERVPAIDEYGEPTF